MEEVSGGDDETRTRDLCRDRVVASRKQRTYVARVAPKGLIRAPRNVYCWTTAGQIGAGAPRLSSAPLSAALHAASAGGR